LLARCGKNYRPRFRSQPKCQTQVSVCMDKKKWHRRCWKSNANTGGREGAGSFVLSLQQNLLTQVRFDGRHGVARDAASSAFLEAAANEAHAEHDDATAKQPHPRRKL